jgi:hypothetical protein
MIAALIEKFSRILAKRLSFKPAVFRTFSDELYQVLSSMG